MLQVIFSRNSVIWRHNILKYSSQNRFNSNLDKSLTFKNNVDVNPTTSVSEGQPRGRLLFLTLIKGFFHETEDIQNCVRSLELRKMHQTQIHRDTPTIRGMIFKCRHLLRVKSISTAELFPEGTEHFGYQFKSAKELASEKWKQKKQAHQRKLERLKTSIDNKEVLNIPPQRKRPSKTHL